MLQGSLSQQSVGLGSLAPETIEVGVVLFTREAGKTASCKPFVVRELFSLHEIIPNWFAFLEALALRHPAWVERDPDDHIQYDQASNRGIYVGEVIGREHEPAVRLVHRNVTGSVRQLLYFSLPREPAQLASTGLTKARKSIGRKASGGLRNLALVILVVYSAPEEEDEPPRLVKNVCIPYNWYASVY